MHCSQPTASVRRLSNVTVLAIRAYASFTRIIILDFYGIIVRVVVSLSVAWPCTSASRLRSRRRLHRRRRWHIVRFAHAVDLRPYALPQPERLLECLFAPHHFLAAVAGRHRVGHFVDDGTAGVDEFAESGRGPVGDQCLVESVDVGFVAQAR